jgi:DnaK suppressor protein
MAVDSSRSRAKLTELRAQAAERLGSASAVLTTLIHDRQGSTDDDEHDPDGVTLSSEWSRLTGLTDAARAKLEQVDHALARLDAGTYGSCASCTQPIPAARLEVRPFAEHCVPCAERLAR